MKALKIKSKLIQLRTLLEHETIIKKHKTLSLHLHTAKTSIYHATHKHGQFL